MMKSTIGKKTPKREKWQLFTAPWAAQCFWLLPVLFSAIYLQCYFTETGKGFSNFIMQGFLCVFVPGALYMTVLIVCQVMKRTGLLLRILYIVLFPITFPVAFFTGLFMYIPAYVKNIRRLLNGEFGNDRRVNKSRVSAKEKIRLWLPLVLLLTVLLPAKAVYENIRFHQWAETPKAAFTHYYDKEKVLGELTDGEQTYMLARAKDGSFICCRFEEGEKGWRIAERMEEEILTEKNGDQVVYAFRTESGEKEVVLVHRKISYFAGMTDNPPPPQDNQHSEFSHLQMGDGEYMNHYYWTAADCDKDHYTVQLP